MAGSPLDSFALCGIVVHELINDLVDRSAAILYDKYLRNKEPEFVVERTLLDAARLLEWQMPRIDGPTHLTDAARPEGLVPASESVAGRGAWLAEDETTPSPIDSWARAAVPTRTGATRSKPTDRSAAVAVGASSPPQAARKQGARSTRAPASQAGGDKADEATARPRSAKTPHVSADAAASASSSAVPAPPSAISAGSPRRPASVPLEAPAPPPPTAAAAAAKADSAESSKREDANRAAARSLRPGQPFTVDERGQLVVVAPPAAARLPPTVLPVSAEVLGSSESGGSSAKQPAASAAAGLSSPLAAAAVAIPATSGAGGAAVRKGAGGRRGSALGGGESVAGGAGAMLSRFYRENTSTQPALASSLPQGVAAGVSVIENGSAINGGDTQPDAKHATRAAFQQRSQDALEASQRAAKAQQRRALASRQAAAAAASAASGLAAGAASPGFGGGGWGLGDGAATNPGGGFQSRAAASPLVVRLLDSIPDTVQQPIAVLETPIPRAQPRLAAVPTHHAVVRSAVEAAAPHAAAELESSPTRLEVVMSHFNRPHDHTLVPPASQPQRPLELTSQPPQQTSPHNGGGFVSAAGAAPKRPRDRLLPPATGQALHHPRPSLAPRGPPSIADVTAAVATQGGAPKDWGETAWRKEPGTIKLAEAE